MAEEEKITLTDEDGSDLSFYVLEQTKFLGNEYFLVTETPESDEVFLLKECISQTEGSTYMFVEDEQELLVVSELFEELLEDIRIKVME